MLMGGAFTMLMLLMFAVALVPLAFWVYSLVEVSRAPEPAFGPPWDNCRNMWLLGLGVSVLIPVGALVTTILWWTQGHSALRHGAPVPRPFWAPRPSYPYAPPPPPVPPPPVPPGPVPPAPVPPQE